MSESLFGWNILSEYDEPMFMLCEALILVLVEHTLGENTTPLLAESSRVLILVLVEHTLGDGKERICSWYS